MERGGPWPGWPIWESFEKFQDSLALQGYS